MRNFRKLNAWVKTHDLNLKIYRETQFFPAHEKYGLVSQIRRACVSVAANIAEGSGHNSSKEYRRYINMALASLSETEYLLLLSKDLEYVSVKKYDLMMSQLNQIKKMLFVLSKNLKNKLSNK